MSKGTVRHKAVTILLTLKALERQMPQMRSKRSRGRVTKEEEGEGEDGDWDRKVGVA